MGKGHPRGTERNRQTDKEQRGGFALLYPGQGYTPGSGWPVMTSEVAKQLEAGMLTLLTTGLGKTLALGFGKALKDPFIKDLGAQRLQAEPGARDWETGNLASHGLSGQHHL